MASRGGALEAILGRAGVVWGSINWGSGCWPGL